MENEKMEEIPVVEDQNCNHDESHNCNHDESHNCNHDESHNSDVQDEPVYFNIPRKWKQEYAKTRSLYLCCKRRLFWYLPVSLHTSKWGAIHAAAECNGVVFIQKYGRDLKLMRKDVRNRKYIKRNHCRKEA